MNRKMKALIALALVIGVSAVALYMVPIMAYQNGTLDQDRIRDCTRNRERDSEHICLQNGNCSCQNEGCLQNLYCHQFQHEECVERMNPLQMGMMGAADSHCYRNQERHKMGR